MPRAWHVLRGSGGIAGGESSTEVLTVAHAPLLLFRRLLEQLLNLVSSVTVLHDDSAQTFTEARIEPTMHLELESHVTAGSDHLCAADACLELGNALRRISRLSEHEELR